LQHVVDARTAATQGRINGFPQLHAGDLLQQLAGLQADFLAME
jgi:hypothetical protein